METLGAYLFLYDVKKHVVSSDTYGNIVYEGILRDKEPTQILGLLYEFLVILIGTRKFSVEENKVSQEGYQYPKCEYVVRLTNDSGIKNSTQFENILFLINK